MGNCNGVRRHLLSLLLQLLANDTVWTFQPRSLLLHGDRRQGTRRSAHADCFVVTTDCDHRFAVRPTSGSPAAHYTWNWCAHFVVPHNLCPWAPASVASNAIRIYSVQDTTCAVNPTKQLLEQISMDLLGLDPNTAIFFVIFENDTVLRDFGAFYEWFSVLEDDWEVDQVTLAPFHPEWAYNGKQGGGNPVDLEKQSPYPTVSLVHSSVIDKAGAAATKQIASNNEQILCQKSIGDWIAIYERAVYGQ